MKRGQIRIIFIWIFILVLAGAILIYGVKNIKNVVNLGEDAIIINFLNKLDDKIQLYYSLDVGSTSVEEFKLTNKIEYVCFTKDNDFSGISLDDKDKKYMESLVNYNNVFLIPSLYNKNRVNISHLDINKNICVNVVGGILNLRLTTRVGGVSVS